MSGKGQRIGYVRVSSIDQNADRQLEHLHVDKLFTDKASGKDTHRPQLQALLSYVREGDTIVVYSMDRLARNVDDLRRIVQEQTRHGIRLEFIKENLTFTGEDSPMANLLSADKLTELPQRVSTGEKKAKNARELGISRQTLYESLRRAADQHHDNSPPANPPNSGI